MSITLNINGRTLPIDVSPTDTLLAALRQAGYFSVRFGSQSGETGAAAVLLDGRLVSSEIILAAQAAGHRIETVESLSQQVGELHPIQKAFIETGAIQSGYSTPAMILAAKALLDQNPNPTEAEVRDALSGVLCRETGYLKPVEAILRALRHRSAARRERSIWISRGDRGRRVCLPFAIGPGNCLCPRLQLHGDSGC
jgi:putative selenate reductase molybdopterin-binding subunit